MPYLVELRTRLKDFAQALRLRRAHGDQLEAEVCLDVTADAIAQQSRARAFAHSAQVHDEEAARLLKAALLPTSPGGPTITPREAAPILRLINRSADADRRAGEACEA